MAMAVIGISVGAETVRSDHGIFATQTATPISTPTSIVTPTPTNTPYPTSTATPISLYYEGFVRISNYWPPDGGTNCAYFVDGECRSRLASLYPWKEWAYKAAACPIEWPFGTIIELDGREWVCLDRGGKIEYVKGIPWIDLLTDHHDYYYGQIVEARIVFPTEEEIECPDVSWQFCSP